MDRVEEILKQYPYIAEDIQREQTKLNMYISLQQEARNPLKGQVLTGMPKINELLDLKKWLDKAFTELTENERRIIYLRYDKGVSMNKMPYVLHWKCGRDKIYQVLNEAKEKIKRIVS
jgi:DNA-directed RNA polymerase specialized sigma subunit